MIDLDPHLRPLSICVLSGIFGGQWGMWAGGSGKELNS
jgi:hypothetical protein